MADYTSTLNLPNTSFSMRANLPQREPEIYKKWEEEGLYSLILEKNEGRPLFNLHDGPPYANGDIHLGHALNKILKDFIMRYKNMSGYKMPYIPGWDTHGLPIENQMLKKHKINRNEVDPLKFRELCAEFARENVSNQMAQMKTLGVLSDWEHPYLTILPEFEAEQIRIFGKMAENGYIYKGMKPVYWCPNDETALAEAEIEYQEDPCESIFVKFKVSDDKGLFTEYTGGLDNVYFVIWTTTTWTLPGNLAICLGPDFEYSLAKKGGEYYVMASELIGKVIEDYEVVAKFKGADLEGLVAEHPFMERPSHIIVGDHVTLESGTGCVHTAPGFGEDDFNVCKKYDYIGITVPVDSRGRMNEAAGKYCGLKTDEANHVILNDLRESGALLKTESIIHQYPHCWRCKKPIIYRATEQWFCSVDGFKDAALEAIKGVKWIPSWGEVRLDNMVSDRSDWCISRQRAWGVPIPIMYCEECGEPLLTPETIEKIAQLFEKEGSNAWLKYSPEEILGDLAHCAKCGGKNFRKEKDIMDVWFDSGSSYAYVLDKREDHHFPADLYLEGNDQYRGWFQSSLLTSVATRGVAPYKSVLTHGMVVDMEGRKMSKSLGNGISPIDVVKTNGADILRLWVSSVDYTADAKISKEILKQLSEIYRKIRNTARIMLANLGDENDFDPNRDIVSVSDMPEIDRWALSRLNALIKEVMEAYEGYEFHLIYHAVNNFCTIDMSKLYVDITKDRVYVEKKDSKDRRSAQTVMYLVLNALTRILAPLLSFTAEEIWQSMPHADSDDKRSVMLNDMPKVVPEYSTPEIEERWNKLFALRDDVMKALEIARANKIIGKSLEAKIKIYAEDKEVYSQLADLEPELSSVFIVSQAEIYNTAAPETAFADTVSGIKIEVFEADGEKCDRCWKHSTSGVKTEDGFICERCQKIIAE
ncbi:MAG: isoleucine--tRNA ligase [Ruminococcaceae bacterium]|nr:isoleucine--tRNA ligase [Oscillospiraceae bacterium]